MSKPIGQCIVHPRWGTFLFVDEVTMSMILTGHDINHHPANMGDSNPQMFWLSSPQKLSEGKRGFVTNLWASATLPGGLHVFNNRDEVSIRNALAAHDEWRKGLGDNG